MKVGKDVLYCPAISSELLGAVPGATEEAPLIVNVPEPALATTVLVPPLKAIVNVPEPALATTVAVLLTDTVKVPEPALEVTVLLPVRAVSKTPLELTCKAPT